MMAPLPNNSIGGVNERHLNWAILLYVYDIFRTSGDLRCKSLIPCIFACSLALPFLGNDLEQQHFVWLLPLHVLSLIFHVHAYKNAKQMPWKCPWLAWILICGLFYVESTSSVWSYVRFIVLSAALILKPSEEHIGLVWCAVFTYSLPSASIVSDLDFVNALSFTFGEWDEICKQYYVYYICELCLIAVEFWKGSFKACNQVSIRVLFLFLIILPFGSAWLLGVIIAVFYKYCRSLAVAHRDAVKPLISWMLIFFFYSLPLMDVWKLPCAFIFCFGWNFNYFPSLKTWDWFFLVHLAPILWFLWTHDTPEKLVIGMMLLFPLCRAKFPKVFFEVARHIHWVLFFYVEQYTQGIFQWLLVTFIYLLLVETIFGVGTKTVFLESSNQALFPYFLCTVPSLIVPYARYATLYFLLLVNSCVLVPNIDKVVNSEDVEKGRQTPMLVAAGDTGEPFGSSPPFYSNKTDLETLKQTGTKRMAQVRNKWGRYPLYTAACGGYLDIVQYLVNELKDSDKRLVGFDLDDLVFLLVVPSVYILSMIIPVFLSFKHMGLLPCFGISILLFLNFVGHANMLYLIFFEKKKTLESLDEYLQCMAAHNKSPDQGAFIFFLIGFRNFSTLASPHNSRRFCYLPEDKGQEHPQYFVDLDTHQESAIGGAIYFGRTEVVKFLLTRMKDVSKIKLRQLRNYAKYLLGKQPYNSCYHAIFEILENETRKKVLRYCFGSCDALTDECDAREDTRLVSELGWYTVMPKGRPWLEYFAGACHSLVFIRIKGDTDEWTYVIEKVAVNGAKYGKDIFISHFEGFKGTFPERFTLRRGALVNADITMKQIYDELARHNDGLYDLKTSHCHHAARDIWNFCVSNNLQTNSIPNQILAEIVAKTGLSDPTRGTRIEEISKVNIFGMQFPCQRQIEDLYNPVKTKSIWKWHQEESDKLKGWVEWKNDGNYFLTIDEGEYHQVSLVAQLQHMIKAPVLQGRAELYEGLMEKVEQVVLFHSESKEQAFEDLLKAQKRFYVNEEHDGRILTSTDFGHSRRPPLFPQHLPCGQKHPIWMSFELKPRYFVSVEDSRHPQHNTWMESGLRKHSLETLQRLDKYHNLMPHHTDVRYDKSDPRFKILTVYHGIGGDVENAKEICAGYLRYTGYRNYGWFGAGAYVTPDLDYAFAYARQGVVIVYNILLFQPYPITEQIGVVGFPIVTPLADCHVAVIRHNNDLSDTANLTIPLPPEKWEDNGGSERMSVEICFMQPQQVLPRAILKFDKT
eukprot:m.339542 g.339542  ORF g.339542 m.339542 type:complete len:1254 (+) comp18861_c0_seq1:111-3872(+)